MRRKRTVYSQVVHGKTKGLFFREVSVNTLDVDEILMIHQLWCRKI